ncbi:hypothetical protein M0M57_10735 [Flavobacterium azooxidireducens]|uniref:Lipocalin-like domain-containing protein n=1 Tax=Flavobacterium azooxidireducens TaxID=1871076 RepID=A0ABY4KEE2_9FLAO|nr:hypothetical protein [Flavobacterium azooxidireducens]UPQ78098.1 hypothetical protein M0M57_10735 [Flavobacterium azooxidireducens]
MKIMRLLYVFLAGFMLFSSCSNNNDDSNNDIIIGKWRTIERYESDEPQEILPCTLEYYKEFKSNNTVAGFIVTPNTFPDPCNQVYTDFGLIWENTGNSNYKFKTTTGTEYTIKIYKVGENLVEEYPDGITKLVYEPY